MSMRSVPGEQAKYKKGQGLTCNQTVCLAGT